VLTLHPLRVVRWSGGYGESKGRFNDVYEYSTPSHSWRLVPNREDSSSLSQVPKPVYLHSAVQYGHQMIVYGGNNSKECNDLYYYDLDTFQWSKAAGSGFMGMGAAMPAARYGHASCVYGGQAASLLIVGGCRSNNSYFKDAWSMDLHSKKWRKLEDLPLDLAYHSLVTWQDRAYLFGGYNGKSFVQHMYVLDSITGKWNILQTSGQVPPPMCGAATVMKGNDLYVFGQSTAHIELATSEFRTPMHAHRVPPLSCPCCRRLHGEGSYERALSVQHADSCVESTRDVEQASRTCIPTSGRRRRSMQHIRSDARRA
jgi:N-acetylneuraminic acid mutarotase